MDDPAFSNGGDTSEFFSPTSATAAVVEDDSARLRKQVDILSAEGTVASRRIEELEAEIQSLKVVAARASALEGDVAHLQQELEDAAASTEEARLELDRARSELEEASRRRSAAEALVAGLDQRVAAMTAERAAAEVEAAARERRIRELETLLGDEREKRGVEAKLLSEKLDRLSAESRDKEASIYEARKAAEDAVEELRALKEALGSRDAKARGSCLHGGGCLDNPWVMAAASTGLVATVTATLYLHFSRKR